eukprot:TRINITY_DN82324_c0_g1_i1.p1 TRINITY_DN82324_c0_g1~~TRINITY_DN82324_c0_g1_i1.p1  ORF type:complete len:485 (-),score=105.89 TRINITY_DN82324_c0_g1_i1:203-1657(-)
MAMEAQMMDMEGSVNSQILAEDPTVPTPMRHRMIRSSSPAPFTPGSKSAAAARLLQSQSGSQDRRALSSKEGPKSGDGSAAINALNEMRERHPQQRETERTRRSVAPTAAALALILAGAMIGFLHLQQRRGLFKTSSMPVVEDPLKFQTIQNGSASSEIIATTEPAPEAESKLPEMVAKAFVCPGTRANVLDVLAGAPYEFREGELKDQAFYRLPRLAASVGRTAAEEEAVASGQFAAEEEAKKAVLQLAATGGGWPDSFRQRLLCALQTPCDAKAVCSKAQAQLPMKVDEQFTSPHATSSGFFHQVLLGLAAFSGIPQFKARAELYRSKPAEVVLSSSPATAESRDCLALRGNVTSVAFRLLAQNGSPAESLVKQIVIEQPPRWAALRPGSLPRHFAIYGDQSDGKYDTLLGNFEYAAAAPAVQAFQLSSPVALKGFRIQFQGPTWGENYICLYRVKAFEAANDACSGSRVAIAATPMATESE